MVPTQSAHVADWLLVNNWVNTLGSVASIALGISLIVLGKKGRHATAFGLFAMLWGLAQFINSGRALIWKLGYTPVGDTLFREVTQALSTFAWVMACLALLWFVLIHPAPELTAKWGHIVGGALALYFVAHGAIGIVRFETEYGQILGMIERYSIAAVVGYGSWLHVARYREATKQQRVELVIMAVAFALYTNWNIAELILALAWGTTPDDWQLWLRNLVVMGATLAFVLAWVWQWARATYPRGVEARNMVLATLGVLATFQLYYTVRLSAGLPPFGILGLIRLAMVLVVTYGILRYGLFGIELKLRWGISRSTIAAAFLGVFLLATTIAGEFLLDAYGYIVGGVAATAFVFLFGPLQRWANSVAEKAVPISAARAEEIYAAAVEAAKRDGTVTRREERHLMEVAEGLSISPTRAMDLLDGAAPN